MEKALIFAKKNKVYGLPLAAILIAFLITILVILPQLLGYFGVQKSIHDLESQAATLNDKTASLGSIDENSFQSNLNIVSAVLPQEKDLPSAIGQVQSVVAASGMQLQGLTFTGAGTDTSDTGSISSGLQTFQAKLDLGGTKQTLKQLVAQVAKGPQIMQISGLDVESGKNGILTATVTLTAYYEEQPSVSSPTDSAPELTQQEKDLLSQLQNQVALSSTNSLNGVLPPRGKTNPFQ